MKYTIIENLICSYFFGFYFCLFFFFCFSRETVQMIVVIFSYQQSNNKGKISPLQPWKLRNPRQFCSVKMKPLIIAHMYTVYSNHPMPNFEETFF